MQGEIGARLREQDGGGTEHLMSRKKEIGLERFQVPRAQRYFRGTRCASGDEEGWKGKEKG